MEKARIIAMHLLRTVLAAVFFYSAISKVMSLELFEMYAYQQGPFSMFVTSIGVRLLIGFELLLGILLVANIFTKTVLWAIIGLLAAFSVFLLYQLLVAKQTGNCHCFGEVMPLDTTESLIKNVVMLGVAALLLLLPVPDWKLRFRLPLVAALAVLAIALPIMLLPLDILFKEQFTTTDRVGQRFQIEKIKDLALTGKKVDVMHGKKVVCMYSLRCIYCKLSARKTSAIYPKLPIKPEIVYFFMGEKQYMESFWKESESTKFPYQLIDPSAFYELAGPELPIIYFLEDGVIKQQLHYSDAFDQDFINFMQK